MTTRLVLFVGGLLLVAQSVPALAQSAPAPAAPAPAAATVAASPWTFGASVGAGGVQRLKLGGGVRLERAWKDSLSLAVRVDAVKDAVSRRRLSMATSLASFVQSSRNVGMTSDVEAPAWYAGVGVVWRARKSGWTPVVSIDGGVGIVTFRPAFTVAGSDVTSSASSYGLTLGSDLTGRSTSAAGGIGLGIAVPKGRWGLEAGGRFTLIGTPAEATRMIGFTASATYRF